jgi:hypothetical protein
MTVSMAIKDANDFTKSEGCNCYVYQLDKYGLSARSSMERNGMPENLVYVSLASLVPVHRRKGAK